MENNIKNKKVAVICGGKSGEREVSLRSGKNVHASLVKQGIRSVILDTDENLITNLKNEKIDIACIMLHGRYGEDGCIQGLLEMYNIPYTGSKVLASAIGMNKIASKKIWISENIPTPKYVEIFHYQDIKKQCENIKKVFPFPMVIKPVSEGSSLGVIIQKTEEGFEANIEKSVKEFKEVFVEEYIKGTEVTVGILGKNNDLTALPILELREKSDFYDFKAKYTDGMTEFIIPARLPKLTYQKVQETAIKAYRSIGCYGYARIDIIVDKDGTPFVHDANTLPGMTDLSDLPAQAKAAGITYDELVLRILESAL